MLLFFYITNVFPSRSQFELVATLCFAAFCNVKRKEHFVFGSGDEESEGDDESEGDQDNEDDDDNDDDTEDSDEGGRLARRAEKMAERRAERMADRRMSLLRQVP